MPCPTHTWATHTHAMGWTDHISPPTKKGGAAIAPIAYLRFIANPPSLRLLAVSGMRQPFPSTSSSSTDDEPRVRNFFAKGRWAHKGQGQYTVGDRLGKGVYGLVCAAMWRIPKMTLDSLDSLDSQDSQDSQDIPVAIKRISRLNKDRDDAHRTLREMQVLRRLNDCVPGAVVKLLDVMVPPRPHPITRVYLVTERFDMDLGRVLDMPAKLGEMEARDLSKQLLWCLARVHACDVVHRDLKPQNVLLRRDPSSPCGLHLSLCDLGMAKCGVHVGGDSGSRSDSEWEDMSSYSTSTTPTKTAASIVATTTRDDPSIMMLPPATTYVTTRWYRAPELCMCGDTDGVYGTPADMWSAGCILAEMLTGRAIFPGKSSAHMLSLMRQVLGAPSAKEVQGVTSAGRPEPACLRALRVPPRPQMLRTPEPRTWETSTRGIACTEAAKDLLKRMLSLDPRARPTALECLRHPYFEGTSPTPLGALEEVPLAAVIPSDTRDRVTSKVSDRELMGMLYEETLMCSRRTAAIVGQMVSERSAIIHPSQSEGTSSERSCDATAGK